MEQLPQWPDGTVATLTTGGHAIPVSLVLRAGPRALLIGLAPSRESLQRLREDGRCAVTILAAGDVAVTAYGRATNFDEAAHVIGVRVEVDEITDHYRPVYTIEDGVPWRWTDADAERADQQARAALRKLSRQRS
jgi:hypothetical protein